MAVIAQSDWALIYYNNNNNNNVIAQISLMWEINKCFLPGTWQPGRSANPPHHVAQWVGHPPTKRKVAGWGLQEAAIQCSSLTSIFLLSLSLSPFFPSKIIFLKKRRNANAPSFFPCLLSAFPAPLHSLLFSWFPLTRWSAGSFSFANSHFLCCRLFSSFPFLLSREDQLFSGICVSVCLFEV